MSSREEKFNKRRLRSSYASVVVSITLVLFILGILATLMIQANALAKKVKEDFTFTAFIDPSVKEAEVKAFLKELNLSEFVKETEFIDREEAAQAFQEELGENFVDFLGMNPLQDAIDIRLKADYVDSTTIQKIRTELLARPEVIDLKYDEDLIKMVNRNINKIGLVLLSGAILLLLVCVALINSSIRLAIYSKRFTLKTMQLVGATRKFIRRPFIYSSLRLGLIGGLIAFGLLTLVFYYGNAYGNELGLDLNPMMLGAIGGSIIGLGLLISWVSTWMAVNKYLNLKTDELYF